VRRPHDHPRTEDLAVLAQHLGDAEIRDIRVWRARVVEEDVGRLEIPVQDTVLVEVADRQGDLLDQRRGPDGVPSEAPYLRLQVARQQLHREVDLTSVFAGLVDRDDVRVVEPGERLDLLPEQTQRERAGVGSVMDHLEGDLALQLQVARLVDHAHAAAADPRPQLVAAEHRAVDHRGLALRPLRRSGGGDALDAVGAASHGRIRRDLARAARADDDSLHSGLCSSRRTSHSSSDSGY
jgi:hypothetical protein